MVVDELVREARDGLRAAAHAAAAVLVLVDARPADGQFVKWGLQTDQSTGELMHSCVSPCISRAQVSQSGFCLLTELQEARQHCSNRCRQQQILEFRAKLLMRRIPV